jgi:hypothetical protein
MRRVIAAHAWLALALAAGCRSAEIVDGVSDSAFVATLAALRRVQSQSGLDSARRTVLRDSILQSRGLTAEALERAASALAESPSRAQRVWRAVERKTAEAPKRGR